MDVLIKSTLLGSKEFKMIEGTVGTVVSAGVDLGLVDSAVTHALGLDSLDKTATIISKKDLSKVVGGTAGVAVAVTGVGLGIVAVPVLAPAIGPGAVVVGGALVGAGISSGINTVQQCLTKEEFDFKEWGIGVGVGALGGAVAAPISAVGGALASGMTSGAAKVGTVLLTEAVSGAASGTVMTVATKVMNGEEITAADCFKSAVVGAAAGLVGGACGQVTSKLCPANTVADAGKSGMRLLVGTAGGAAGGAGSGAVATFLMNAMTHGEFKRDGFIKALVSCGASEEIAEKLWAELCRKGIVVREQVKKPLSDDVHFSEELEPYREGVKIMIEKSLDYWKGVGSAAAQGAVTGGVMGLLSANMENRRLQKQVKEDAHVRAEQIRRGGYGGSIEAEAYGQMKGRQVVIHHDDGSITKHGPKSPGLEIHMKYNSETQHYTPADASGKAVPFTPSHNPGDCLFASLAHGTGETPAAVRQDVSDYMYNNPMELKRTGLQELSAGGFYMGGGRMNLSNTERWSAVNSLSKTLNEPGVMDELLARIEPGLKNQGVTDPKQIAAQKAKWNKRVITRQLYESLDGAIGEIRKMDPSSLNQRNTLKPKTPYCLHDVGKGCIAADLHYGPFNEVNRGPCRAIFKVTKGGREINFKYIAPVHNYKKP